MRFGFWRKSSFKKIQIGGYRCRRIIYVHISTLLVKCQRITKHALCACFVAD